MNTETEQVPGQETLPGLDVIEGIDMDLEVQCEDPNEDHAHDHPADVRVAIMCPNGCAPTRRFYCWRAYHQLRRLTGRHVVCGWIGEPEIIVVETLR